MSSVQTHRAKSGATHAEHMQSLASTFRSTQTHESYQMRRRKRKLGSPHLFSDLNSLANWLDRSSDRMGKEISDLGPHLSEFDVYSNFMRFDVETSDIGHGCDVQQI